MRQTIGLTPTTPPHPTSVAGEDFTWARQTFGGLQNLVVVPGHSVFVGDNLQASPNRSPRLPPLLMRLSPARRRLMRRAAALRLKGMISGFHLHAQLILTVASLLSLTP